MGSTVVLLFAARSHRAGTSRCARDATVQLGRRDRRAAVDMSDWRPTASIATLEVRASMLRAAREYFAATRALEVETPTLSAAAVTDVHLASVAGHRRAATRAICTPRPSTR